MDLQEIESVAQASSGNRDSALSAREGEMPSSLLSETKYF